MSETIAQSQLTFQRNLSLGLSNLITHTEPLSQSIDEKNSTIEFRFSKESTREAYQIQLLEPVVLVLPPLHDKQLSQRKLAVMLPSELLLVPSSTVIRVLDV
jgi:hypothetical protein